jgi:hypothetical protein
LYVLESLLSELASKALRGRITVRSMNPHLVARSWLATVERET